MNEDGSLLSSAFSFFQSVHFFFVGCDDQLRKFHGHRIYEWKKMNYNKSKVIQSHSHRTGTQVWAALFFPPVQSFNVCFKSERWHAFKPLAAVGGVAGVPLDCAMTMTPTRNIVWLDFFFIPQSLLIQGWESTGHCVLDLVGNLKVLLLLV